MSDVETFYCLIVGSRSFSDYELFVAKCDLLLRNWGSVVIVSGGARGADALAKRYAVDRGYCYMEFPADWDTYGRRAGYIRNRAMHPCPLWYTIGTLSEREKGTEMGYYVRIEETASNFKIKKENFERGYEIVCDLNRHDYLKHGGKFGGDPTPKPADSKSCAGNPDVWFSWMPWNYDELCGNLVEVLEMVGFGVEFDDAGNISGLSYDDKTGCEETFLNALKPVIEEGSYLTWVGEEGGEWGMVF